MSRFPSGGKKPSERLYRRTKVWVNRQGPLYPARKGLSLVGIPSVEQQYRWIVVYVTYRTSDALIHCFHARVLVEDVSCVGTLKIHKISLFIAYCSKKFYYVLKICWLLNFIQILTTFSFRYFIFSCNSRDFTLGYGIPTTITHRPKLSEKFNPSLNFPP